MKTNSETMRLLLLIAIAISNNNFGIGDFLVKN